ncbi:DUF2800 domain-containing protein [bacterium]|nr:DUF2800 domain-containing protein [bacterium]
MSIRLPPSAAHIWGAPDGCTGWVQMCDRVEDLGSKDASSEGSRVGALATAILKDPAHKFDSTLYTQEMLDAVAMYVDDVNRVMAENPQGVVGFEEHVKIKDVHDECEGSIDAYLYSPQTKVLHIWDFKYGHRVVDEYRNIQLLLYFFGLQHKSHYSIWSKAPIDVVMTIVQPRAFAPGGPIRSWRVNSEELRSLLPVINANAHTALSPRATTRSGTHCRDCHTRHACKTALDAGMSLYELAQLPVPQQLAPEALGVQLSIIKRAAEQLKFLETGYRAQVESLASLGTNIPGWGMKHTVGAKAWTGPMEDALQIGDLLDIDIRKPLAVITPTQAIKAGLPLELVDSMSARPSTGTKLIEEDMTGLQQVFRQENNHG